jgi:hypothetical protein
MPRARRVLRLEQLREPALRADELAGVSAAHLVIDADFGDLVTAIDVAFDREDRFD